MERKISTLAVVPAAGCGRRLGKKTRKPFITLGGKPLIVHALKALSSARPVNAIIVAVERPYIKRFLNIIKRYRIGKVKAVVAGGRTRYESVRNCIKEAGPSFDIILIHDAARPFVDSRLIGDSIRAAHRHGGCVVAVPESDTVKLSDGKGFVKKTLDRNMIYRAQTPQAFRAGIIRKAYLSKRRRPVTDDASLAEAAGLKVKILEGSRTNIKITAKEDLKIGGALL